MSDEQSVEDLAEKIMGVAIRTGKGISTVNAEEQILELLQSWQPISEDWLPTPENINALPEPVRKFIHDIESNCDPAGLVRENLLIKDTCTALVLKLEEKGKVTEESIDIYVNQIAHACDKYKSWDALKKAIKNRILNMIKEAGLKVVKEKGK